MTLDSYRQHCLSKSGATETFPFDEATLVHKVANKMFALTNVIFFKRINVKCDPAQALCLRERYHDIIPAWHMNKKHWNSILLNGEFTDQQIFQWIDHSYELVVARLPKKVQALIK
ncbi:MAG: MmcQ/YjbR family DNA-binding protein [Bacteroidota bacterium]